MNYVIQTEVRGNLYFLKFFILNRERLLFDPFKVQLEGLMNNATHFREKETAEAFCSRLKHADHPKVIPTNCESNNPIII